MWNLRVVGNRQSAVDLLTIAYCLLPTAAQEGRGAAGETAPLEERALLDIARTDPRHGGLRGPETENRAG